MDDPSEMLRCLVLEETPPVDRLTECFRCLRNTCAGGLDVQSKLAEHGSVLSDTNSAIDVGLTKSNSEEWTVCLRISAQFLGNLVVNNPKTQNIVWTCCSLHLRKMAQHGDTKLTDICLMVVYQILLGCPNLTKDLISDREFIGIICQSGADGLEFAQYILEHLLGHDVNWPDVYSPSMSVRERLFVLDVVESVLKQSAEHIPVTLVTLLATRFRNHSDCILRTVADRVDSLEPVEVATLLQLLSSCSAHSPHLQALQADKSFFINCAFLLRSVHLASKQPDNVFTSVPKLSATDDQMQHHPAFGFKANLVRVLANLCWRHKQNQDLMREAEVIAVLLDCCNIDSRNPFIIQWVVLAVRNLCENNLDNQAVIAGMTREGLVQSAVLMELGLTLHSDGDNQICLAPLNTGSLHPQCK